MTLFWCRALSGGRRALLARRSSADFSLLDQRGRTAPVGGVGREKAVVKLRGRIHSVPPWARPFPRNERPESERYMFLDDARHASTRAALGSAVRVALAPRGALVHPWRGVAAGV
jgi:hypothetical protein